MSDPKRYKPGDPVPPAAEFQQMSDAAAVAAGSFPGHGGPGFVGPGGAGMGGPPHRWIEIILSGTGPAYGWTEADDGGRSGTSSANPAREVNGKTGLAGKRVRARFGPTDLRFQWVARGEDEGPPPSDCPGGFEAELCVHIRDAATDSALEVDSITVERLSGASWVAAGSDESVSELCVPITHPGTAGVTTAQYRVRVSYQGCTTNWLTFTETRCVDDSRILYLCEATFTVKTLDGDTGAPVGGSLVQHGGLPGFTPTTGTSDSSGEVQFRRCTLHDGEPPAGAGAPVASGEGMLFQAGDTATHFGSCWGGWAGCVDGSITIKMWDRDKYVRRRQCYDDCLSAHAAYFAGAGGPFGGTIPKRLYVTFSGETRILGSDAGAVITLDWDSTSEDDGLGEMRWTEGGTADGCAASNGANVRVRDRYNGCGPGGQYVEDQIVAATSKTLMLRIHAADITVFCKVELYYVNNYGTCPSGAGPFLPHPGPPCNYTTSTIEGDEWCVTTFQKAYLPRSVSYESAGLSPFELNRPVNESATMYSETCVNFGSSEIGHVAAVSFVLTE